MADKPIYKQKTSWFSVIAGAAGIVAVISHAVASGQVIPWDQVVPEIVAIGAAVGALISGRQAMGAAINASQQK